MSYEGMKILASSKGQIVPELSDESQDYICELTLTDMELTIERDEYAKDKICLFDIPLHKIVHFDFVNKKEQERSFWKAALKNLAGVSAFLFLGSGFLYHKDEAPDVLTVTFYNNQGKKMTLTFDMMEYGERSLTKKYSEIK